MNDRWDRRYRIVLIALVVLSLVLVTLTFRAGASGVVVGSRNALLAITAPFGKLMTWVASPFVGTWRFLGGLATLSRNNAQLTQEVGVLKQETVRLHELEVENAMLRKLSNMNPPPPGTTAVATIIGYVPGGWDRGLIIDLGKTRGVKIGAPVLVPEGLVGQVVRVAPGAAEVRLITDPRGGAGAMIQETRNVGVTEGSVTGDLYLRFISRDALVKKGFTVVTSGLGGAYPKGLLIGTVKAVSDPGTGLYEDISIATNVDFAHLERVVVLVDYPQAVPTFGVKP